MALPGIITPPGLMGTARDMTLTLKSFNTSESDPVPYPLGIEAGDLIIFGRRASNTSSPGNPIPTDATPSGYTAIYSDGLDSTSSSGVRACGFWKIASGLESGGSLSGAPTGNGTNRSFIAVFEGPIASATMGDQGGTITHNNPSARTINVGSGTPPLMAIAVLGCNSPFSVSSNWVTGWNTVPAIGDSAHMHLLYLPVTDSPTNMSYDMNDQGTANTLFGCYLNLT